MSKQTPCSIVNDFRENGNETVEYPEIISDLLIAYCKTEDYCTMKKIDQVHLIDRCQEIKNLIKAICKLDSSEYTLPCAI